MIGWLPNSIEIAGEERKIRTDYRDALTIMEAFNDPELGEKEKTVIMLTILYKDLVDIPQDFYGAAIEKAVWFLDGGQEKDDSPNLRLMDWKQDEHILFPAINKLTGREVRAMDYMHWWTFLGYFMEIEEGTFSTVLGIRQKKAKGKKLEKWEDEFYRSNRKLCDLKTRLTQEEQAEIDGWNKLLE